MVRDYIPDICSKCGGSLTGDFIKSWRSAVCFSCSSCNSCLAELRPCNTLQSEGWKRFIIHCSSQITRGCESRTVQFHVRIRGGERNACSWTQDTDRSVRFNLYSPACRQQQCTRAYTNMHYSKSSLLAACLNKPPQHGNAFFTQRPLILATVVHSCRMRLHPQAFISHSSSLCVCMFLGSL